jgi:cell division septum initiation protein DivIVA
MGENRLMADLYEENQRLKARIEELEEKHFSECGQIAHYDDERKKIKEYLQHSAKTMTVHGVHEALALIGEDGDTNG